MSTISNLLLEKAASFLDEVESIASEASPEVESSNSWEQIKQAAVDELVATKGLSKEAASSLVDTLKENI